MGLLLCLVCLVFELLLMLVFGKLMVKDEFVVRKEFGV